MPALAVEKTKLCSQTVPEQMRFDKPLQLSMRIGDMGITALIRAVSPVSISTTTSGWPACSSLRWIINVCSDMAFDRPLTMSQRFIVVADSYGDIIFSNYALHIMLSNATVLTGQWRHVPTATRGVMARPAR